MTLTYFKKTVAKNTDPVAQNVKITYTFTEADGKFSGTGDDNVHVQHTMQYINALVEADKQFEMQLYPDDNHHLRQGNNAKHMHEKILRFLNTNL